jgi:NAD(P)-dependent dehydrogenase (short-subunit alcohol dehydrogenase family)
VPAVSAYDHDRPSVGDELRALLDAAVDEARDAHEVRVNALAPGFTLTDASLELIEDAATYGVARGSIKRALQPDDIVGTAVFLASPAAAMISGQTFVVDGGRQFL